MEMEMENAIAHDIEALKVVCIEVDTFSCQLALLLGRLYFLLEYLRRRIAMEPSKDYTGSLSTFSAMTEEVKSIVQSCASADKWVERTCQRLEDGDRIQNITRCLAEFSRKAGLTRHDFVFGCAFMDAFAQQMDIARTSMLLEESKRLLVKSHGDSEALRKVEKALNSTIMVEADCLPGLRKHHCCSEHIQSNFVRLLGPFGNLGSCSKYPLPSSKSERDPVHSFLDVLSSHEDHPEESSEKHTDGFGATYREVWSESLVAVKRVKAEQFIRKLDGMREAVALVQGTEHFPNITGKLRCSSIEETLSLLKRASEEALCLQPLLTACVHAGVGYFVTPLAPYGSLYDALLVSAACPALVRSKATDDMNSPFLASTHLRPYHKCSILLDVATGLSFLHEKGIPHGRLKTANVLLYENGRAKLADYAFRMFLSQHAREETVGVDGVRWRSPEDLNEETTRKAEQTAYRERSTAAVKNGQPPLPSNALILRYGSDLPDIVPNCWDDIYCFGLLIYCLLKETPRPYDNILWSDGVRALLQREERLQVPTSYPDKDALITLEPWFVRCTEPAFHRPEARELQEAVDKLFRFEAIRGLEKLRDVQVNLLESVDKEIRTYNKKIKETSVMIDKGKELIDKKELEVYKLSDPKEKKNSQIALIRARTKLNSFETDLEGYKRDLEGAQGDRGELEKRVQAAQEKIVLGQNGCFDALNRTWSKQWDQEMLLDRYCTIDERDQIARIVRPAALKEYVESQLSLPFETSEDDFIDLDPVHEHDHSLLTSVTDATLAMSSAFSSLLKSANHNTSIDHPMVKPVDRPKERRSSGSWFSSVFASSQSAEEHTGTVSGLNVDQDDENPPNPSPPPPSETLKLVVPSYTLAQHPKVDHFRDEIAMKEEIDSDEDEEEVGLLSTASKSMVSKSEDVDGPFHQIITSPNEVDSDEDEEYVRKSLKSRN